MRDARTFLDPSTLKGDPFWAFARAMLRYRRSVATAALMACLSAFTLGAGMVGAQPILQNILGARKDLPTLAAELNGQLARKAPGLSWARVPRGWIDAMPANDPFAALVWIMGVLMALAVVGAVATYLHAYLSLTVVNRTVGAARRRAFRSVLRAPLRTVIAGGTSDAIARIINDSAQLANGLNVLLSRTIIQALKGVAGLLAALWFDWRVTLVALLAAPVLYTIIRKLGKRIRRASGAALESQSEMLRVANESLQGLRVVKAYDAEWFEGGRFQRVNRRMIEEMNRVRTARAVASPLTETLTLLALCVMVIFAARAILAGNVEPTDFILAIVALAVAGASIKPLTGLAHDIQTATPAAERLRELIALPPEPGHDRTLPALPRHRRSIEWRGVTLTYPGREAPALNDVNVSVAHGESVAFVGPNGCGKTTLLSLVNRVFDPDGGRVLIDGVDLRDVGVRSVRRQIGVVTQETVLFRATIRENIAYGSAASDRAVIDAAERARAHDFISRLPQGYETPVAEQGLSLSGGQRQRIAIARAILRDPAILVLDEATSMVDAESEAQIAQTLAEFSKGRTCLVVAHRLSTVLSCDRIVVMDAGRVVDQGRHAELMGRCGLYRQLAGAQLGAGHEEHAVGRA